MCRYSVHTYSTPLHHTCHEHLHTLTWLRDTAWHPTIFLTSRSHGEFRTSDNCNCNTLSCVSRDVGAEAGIMFSILNICSHKWGTQFSCLSWSCAEVFAILMPTLGLDGYIYHLGTKFHDKRQEEKYYPISSILLCNFCFPKDAVPTHYVQIWLRDIMFVTI